MPRKVSENFAIHCQKPRGHQGHQPRIIKLPTVIKLKRIEGAFVPSRLQEESNAASEQDHQKQLTKKLNVILNRMSDANLQITIDDIRGTAFESADDTQLLAKTLFNKVSNVLTH